MSENRNNPLMQNMDAADFSKQMMNVIDNGVSDSILILSRDFRIIWANRAAVAQGGLGWEDVIGNTCHWISHRRDKPCTAYGDVCPCEQILKLGETVTAIHEHYDADGNKFFHEVTVYPVKGEGGDVVQFIHLTRDITERMRDSEALRENEAMQAKLQEIAHLGSWEFDLATNSLKWSDEVYRIFGVKPQEFGATYEAFLEAVHPEDRRVVEQKYFDSIEMGRDGYEIQHRIVRKDTGEVRVVREKCEHVRNDSGKVVKSRGMISDVTDQNYLEKALTDQAHALRERVRELNCLCEISRLTEQRGNTLEDVLQNSAELIPQGFQFPEGTAVCIVLNGRRYTTENYRDTEWKTESVIRASGREVGSIAVNRLVSTPVAGEDPFLDEERYLIDAIAERLGMIAERYFIEEDMKRIHQEILRLDSMRSDFTSMVSHELRTPLSSIKEGIDIILDGIDGPLLEAQSETLGIVKRNVDRLARLINSVLDFSRLESGKVEMNFKRVFVDELLMDIYKLMRVDAAKHGIQFSIDMPSERIRAVCDADKIRQVVANLVDNAFKYTESGGRVVIRPEHVDGTVRIDVADTGRGIAAENFDKIFEMFSQASRDGGPKPPGTGLGLGIARQIMDLHRGEIRVRSAFGKGSTFTVVFPDNLPEPA